MKPSEEALHLLAAFRQLGTDQQRVMVRRILETACRRLKVPADNFDALVSHCLAVKKEAAASAVDKALADLVRLSVNTVESVQPVGLDRFVDIALMYAATDDDLHLGAKFSTGGKKRSGTVKKAVRRVLKSKPASSAADVWAILERKPPPGMTFFESPWFGRYIEKDGEPETKYPRFRNIVSEVKRELLALE